MPLPAVVALLAHPDDETLACGATLALLAERGWAVRVVLVGDGIVTARGGVQDNRADLEAACSALGVGPATLLGFPDQRFDTVAVSDIVNAVRSAVPPADLVITNAASDLNRDHQIVSHVARVFARPIERPVALLEAEVPAAGSWNGTPSVPNWYVDVTASLDRKLEALRCYGAEARSGSHPCAPENVEALARVHGAASGLGLAEAFHVVRGCAGLLP